MQGRPENLRPRHLDILPRGGFKITLCPNKILYPCLKALYPTTTFVVRKWTCITKQNQAQHDDNFIVFFLLFLAFVRQTLARSFF
jgi:hypothetical protein